MGLSEIAAGLEVTETQEEHSPATVDTTDASLTERLAPFASEFPCSAEAAATILERYSEGKSIGDAGRGAGVAPVTAAKTLHLLGESVSPVSSLGADIIQDWITGQLSRTEAMELAQLGENEFALAVYVETHEPLKEACAAVEGVLAARQRNQQRPLAETMSETTDLL